MTSMLNFLKRSWKYALLIGIILILLFTNIQSNRARLSTANEYSSDIRRVEAKYAEFNESVRQSLEILDRLEGTLTLVDGRLEAVEGGLKQLTDESRGIGDTAIESGILNDRNLRLLAELSKRVAESGTEE